MRSTFRITDEPRPYHAACVSSWSDILHRDTNAVFLAASRVSESAYSGAGAQYL